MDDYKSSLCFNFSRDEIEYHYRDIFAFTEIYILYIIECRKSKDISWYDVNRFIDG